MEREECCENGVFGEEHPCCKQDGDPTASKLKIALEALEMIRCEGHSPHGISNEANIAFQALRKIYGVAKKS